jgi:hypothetical protein
MRSTKPTKSQLAKIKQSRYTALKTVVDEELGIAKLNRRIDAKCLSAVIATGMPLAGPEGSPELYAQLARLNPDARAELAYEYATGRALATLAFTDSLRRMFPAPQRRDETTFGKRHVRKAVRLALARDDTKFFVAMGKVLERKQRKVADFKGMVRNLDAFLINNWVKGSADVPPLYNLPIAELARVCQQKIKVSNFTSAAIEKRRQRLGLMSFRIGSVARQ